MMVLTNFLDTLLNLWVFAFLGVLVWLYFKKDVDDKRIEDQEKKAP
jgi:hypothetical protein